MSPVADVESLRINMNRKVDCNAVHGTVIATIDLACGKLKIAAREGRERERVERMKPERERELVVVDINR